MTTTDQLQRIRAKCIKLINGYNGSRWEATQQAVAGWRATIAAIDALKTQYERPMGCASQAMAETAINAIIAAWPEELL